MSTVFGKTKSGGSIRLQHRSSSKKSSVSSRKVCEEEEPVNENNIKEEECKSIKQINYREELTFLFLYSMFDDIIQEREILSFEDIYSKVSDDIVTITIVYKETAPEYEVSMIPMEGSKYVSIQSKSKSSSYNKLSLSKKGSGLPGSVIISEGQSKSSHDTSDEGVGLGWVVETEDRFEKITFKNGNTYKGHTSGYLMHGYGTFHWADGANYEGYFKNGYPDGCGKIVLPDLCKYEGDFCKSYFHGTGTLYISGTPAVYNGAWKNGKKHGKGWMLYSRDNSYDGEWFEDEKHGFGYRQYKNGAKYKGQWCHNKKNGEGSMLWENNDYYVGDWADNKPHGYGEYTWNIFFNRSLTFPYYNWYKGSWVEGARTGAGIMNFGTISGATLAGIWKNNFKHGPGIMVCGNGLILQRNPLFENDKPVHLVALNKSVDIYVPQDASEKEKSQETVIGTIAGSQIAESQEESLFCRNSFKEILRDINSKVAMKTFDDAILARITKSGLNISQNQFIKLEPSTEENRIYCPLDIPIHTVAEDVNLEYYVQIIIDYYENAETVKKYDDDDKRIEMIDQDFSPSTNSELKGKQSGISSLENSFCYDKDNETRILRNIITVYLPELTAIYNRYTTIGSKDINYKCILIRLFLWQLLRDIGLPQQGVTLIEADLFLADNPHSCIDTNHNPFEPIYFWQFLLSLFGCSWLLYVSKNGQSYENFTNGTTGKIFKQFLEETVFPNAGTFEGSALTEYKDMLPIPCVYKLYLTIGEPHSVRQFLYFTFIKKGKDPPCCAALNGDDETKSITEGFNAVPICHQIIYLQVKDDLIASKAEPPIEDENADIFSKSLYAFRKLGRKQIIKCLIKICPRINYDGKVNMDYKLSFLEFHEVLLLCAYEIVERKRRLLEIEYNQQQTPVEPSLPILPKIGKEKPGKKKK